MKTSNIQFCVGSHLYQAGRTEDGDALTAVSYYAVATLNDGTRYAHDKSFSDTEFVKDDDHELGGYFSSIDDAQESAEKLVARIQAAKEINLDHWDLIEPVYGSSQYDNQGCEAAQIQREREAG